MPLDAAIARLDSKTPVASALTSAEWAQMPLALRERAFFISTVENLRTVGEAQNRVREALAMTDGGRMNKATFVSEMRGLLGAAPGDSGELTDITSRRRLELIYNHNIEAAREYARHAAGQDPDLLDAFPAQELIRMESREKPRDWKSRWADAGGKFYDGRPIAPKGDPVWEKISRFGTPWPPFDFGSGMGVGDIERDEAEALGVLKPGQTVAPTLQDFNAKLEASMPENLTPALKQSFQDIFGDQIEFTADGKAAWVPDLVGTMYDDAIAGKNLGTPVNFGKATPDLITVAQRDLGIDLTGWTMEMKGDEIRHDLKDHGLPGIITNSKGASLGETQPDQIPLTKADFRAVPLVWRMPDKMESSSRPHLGALPPAGFPDSIRIQSNIAGQLYAANYYININQKRLGFISAWRKKP